MQPKCNPANDHFGDKHDVVPQVGVLHMILTQFSHVPAAIYSCIITAAKGEPLTVISYIINKHPTAFVLSVMARDSLV